MATFPTWLEIKTRVISDLDIEDEDFVDADDLKRYGNSAVNELEQEIITTYPDYFLKNAWVTLVSGTDEYDMPSDIYQNKIRRILYKNGVKRYRIERARDWHKFEEHMEREIHSSSEDCYIWFPTHSTPGEPKILLAPEPQEDGQYVRVWYIRNANRFVDDTSVLDIAEGQEYVYARIAKEVRKKENGGVALPSDIQEVEAQKALFMQNLIDMVPDTGNELEPDMSHYEMSV